MTSRTLIILDGIGIRQAAESNAFSAAHKPTLDRLMQHYPTSQVATSGMAVGLPEGQMGNSEVGHMNLGAGRVVYQNFTRINKAIEEGEFQSNPAIAELLTGVRARNGAVHVLGLVSPGGVHSHEDQILELCQVLSDNGVERFYLHAFLDGRDTPPRSAHESLRRVDEKLTLLGCGRIGSVIGRYYALDRDNRWARVEHAYRLIVEGQAQYESATALAALGDAYARGESDEFVKATRIGEAVPVQPEDAFIFMNFRPDRARQLCHALIDHDFAHFQRPLVVNRERLLTLTRYSNELDTPCAFPPEPIDNCLGEYISGLGNTQLRIAETEKYAHVTFFFNGGREEPFPGEERILIPSPPVDSYDLQPEMSAPELTERLVDAIASQRFDLIICNYANGDMVGHTGSFEASVKAVEAVDQCLAQVVDAVLAVGGECLITADHGNVEQMLDPETGQAHTSHTLNPVPLILVSAHRQKAVLQDGRLCDLAPTLLQMMGLEIPPQMKGTSLLKG